MAIIAHQQIPQLMEMPICELGEYVDIINEIAASQKKEADKISNKAKAAKHGG